MARKNTNVYRVKTAAGADTFSLAASFTTPPTIVTYMDNCAYQIDITTTNSTGSFVVQASLDYAVDALSGTVINAGHWIILSLAGGSPIANAANDDIMINLNQLPFIAIRLSYTADTAGTGTCVIYLSSKQLSG